MLPGDAWGPLNGRCAKPSFNSSYVLRGGVVGPEGRGEKGLRGAGRELHLDGWNRDRSSGRSWSGREGARRRAAAAAAAREAGEGWKIPGAGAA